MGRPRCNNPGVLQAVFVSGTADSLAQVVVPGSAAHPLFGWLRSEQGGVLGDAIKWNFTKFLIGRDGRPVRRYAPAAIEADIRERLAESV